MGTFVKRRWERLRRGSFRNVIISNIEAVGVDNIGCSITGVPGHPVASITVKDVRIQFRGGGTLEPLSLDVPEKEEAYPEYKMFGMLPAYGFYVRHADNIRFENMEVDYLEPESRPAFVFDQVNQLDLDHVDATVGSQTLALMVMRNVEGAMVSNCFPKHAVNVFLKVDESRGINLIHNVFSRVAQIFQTGEKMTPDAVFEAFNRR